MSGGADRAAHLPRGLRVGLTGGIACGKSVVRHRLQRAGLVTLDLDEVARDVMAPGGSAYAPIVDAFGAGILAADETIDRARLGGLVFSNEEERRRLEAIVHPLVREVERRYERSIPEGEILVVDAALLVETGGHPRFDRLIVVHCDESTQMARLRRRDGLGEEAARRRIEAQMRGETKRGFAHFVIDSGGSLEGTERAADSLGAELRELAERRPAVIRLRFEQGLAAMQHGATVGPCGLDPAVLLESLVREGGLDLGAVARLLRPASRGPWYEAATASGLPGPEALAVPLVLWACAAARADSEWLASAATSLARLTHRTPRDWARACFVAVGMLEAVKAESGNDAWRPSAGARRLAEHWGLESPDEGLEVALTTGWRCAGRPTEARSLARRLGVDVDLAGAVAGLVSGVVASREEGRLDSLLRVVTRA
jgi:dephospho-CoA kinase